MLADLLTDSFGSLSTWALIYGAAVTFGAGWLRGYTGFGFALAAVPALSLVVEPARIVPVAMLLQIVAGTQLIPKTRHLVDWRAIRPLLVGAALGTPVGTLLLAKLPAPAMRGLIGLLLLVAIGLLWRGVRLRREPGLALTLGVGAASGLLNGGTAMGGPPAVVYFLASPRTVAVSRASMLMYFLFITLMAFAGALVAGLVAVETLVLTAAMFPFLALGNLLGDRGFDRSAEKTYLRVALGFLAVIALVALGRALEGFAAAL